LLGIVAALSFSLVVATRISSDATSLALATTKAQLAADGAAMLAIVDLVQSAGDRERRRFPSREPGRTCALAGADVHVSVWDEGGKVDLNAAPESLLAALLVGTGIPVDRGKSLAAAITEYRGSPSKRTLDEARAAYGAASRAGPKLAAFAVVEELGQVLGFDESSRPP
jgi:general secretion pathway protein K